MHDAAATLAAIDRLPEPKAGSIVVCTLGGVADIGMNLTLYGALGGWVLVDAGTTFAPREVKGVEAVMPDPRFLTALGDRLKGMVVSHWHQDHVGAITEYWPRYAKCPIWAPPFAARMLSNKLQEAGTRGEVKLNTFEPGATLRVGPFRIRTVRVAHSTPDCVAFAFEAQGARVLQTNDWKIDPEPGVGSRTDMGAFARLGGQGVDLMLCDSTNADREVPQTSEASVRRGVEAVMRRAKGMVFVCSFGSNVARMASVAHAAKAARRKVALAGRSLREAAAAAEALGIMKGVPPFLEDAAKFGSTQRNGCVLMCTGTQGEENAALAKLAHGSDKRLPKILPGDVVIHSARAIPGKIHRRQQQTIGIGISGDHQPPQGIGVLGGEAHGGALEVQAGAQKPKRRASAGCGVGQLRHTRQNVDPIDHGRGRPEVRFDADAVEHAAVGGVVACQRVDRRELADAQVCRGQRRAAHQSALHELRQRVQHTILIGIGQRPSCLLSDRKQVRGQRVLALQAICGEVFQQTVAVHVRRQALHQGVPTRAIAQGDRLRCLLLETDVGVAAHVLAHAIQAAGERGLQRHLEAAAAGDRTGGPGHGPRQRRRELRDRGLISAHRERRGDGLEHFEMIVSSTRRFRGGHIPG